MPIFGTIGLLGMTAQTMKHFVNCRDSTANTVYRYFCHANNNY